MPGLPSPFLMITIHAKLVFSSKTPTYPSKYSNRQDCRIGGYDPAQADNILPSMHLISAKHQRDKCQRQAIKAIVFYPLYKQSEIQLLD